jgi:alpha-beta hydrolase superfamily lysophospholipase
MQVLHDDSPDPDPTSGFPKRPPTVPLASRIPHATDHVFASHDGAQIAYRHWPSASNTRRHAIVLLHRGHEHSGRIAHLVDELNLPELDFFAWDARGHGMSPGARGDSPSFGAAVKDLDAFIRHIEAAHGIPTQNVCIVAQSVGAVLAATWAHDYAPRIRALVLAAPAFQVKLYVPFARQGLKLISRLRGNFFVNSYVKARFLTHDPERIASYKTDPLIARAISVRMLLGLYDAAERVVEDAAAITVPTQVLLSGADWVVRRAPQQAFYRHLGAEDKEIHTFRGFYHDTLGEKDRHLSIAKARAFLVRQFEKSPTPLQHVLANQVAYTTTEFQRIAQDLPLPSAKRLQYSLVRASMRTVGRFSAGIRTGIQTGFDSGSTLDYVYRNQPDGITPIGRMIDRNFLEAVGWKGIRVRKTHLEHAIDQGARLVRDNHLPVRLLDLAAGHGRYVVDAVQRMSVKPWSVLLRDYSAQNVVAGQQLIRERQLQDLIQFVEGDAFDADGIASIDPKPTLAIVSGLYELFPENDLVNRSLSGLSRAVPVGGCLIYTGQPWHPQLEFIARTLTSHRNGAPWIMRRRTQGELDQLVADAGFRKVDQWIDEWGIFTVSIAVRTK